LDKQRCPNILPADSAGFSRTEHGNEPIPVRRVRPPPPALVGNRAPGPQFMDEDDWEAFEREDEEWDEGKEEGGQAKPGEEMKDEEQSEEGEQPVSEDDEAPQAAKAPVEVSESEEESAADEEGDEEAQAAKKKPKKKSKKPKPEIVVSSEESEQPKDFEFSGFSSGEE
jgi:hypothetical protein